MKVSSPDKILFPARPDGSDITKAEVVAHYEQVGSAMAGLIAGRPLTLQRFPKGIDAKGFMQKNVAKHFPESIGRHTVPKRSGGETVYPVVDHAEDLAWLANQNAITFHMWTSTAAEPLMPDWMVIDLDPEAGDLGGVREVTRLVAETLGQFNLNGVPVATGSKGFHVWVRLDGSLSFGDVSRVSRAIAGLVVLEAPELATTEFLKKNRGGRVFVDWLRNGPYATVVVPLSLRPRAGAPVAVPLEWGELGEAQPDSWRIAAIDDRLALAATAFDLPPSTLAVETIVEAAVAAGVDMETPHDRFGRS